MRGGKREGAGRKPSGYRKRVIFSCRIHPDTDAGILALSADTGLGKGEIVDLLLRWYLEDCTRQGRDCEPDASGGGEFSD